LGCHVEQLSGISATPVPLTNGVEVRRGSHALGWHSLRWQMATTGASTLPRPPPTARGTMQLAHGGGELAI
jgi:hypothetical protein